MRQPETLPGGTSKDLLWDLLDAVPDAMVVVGEDGRVRFVNAEALRLFGYRLEELVGQSVEVLVPDGHRGAHAGHRRAFDREPRARPMAAGIDLPGRRKDGSEFPAEISLAPTRSASGPVVVAAVRDVSDRRMAERARARLAAIVESADAAIYSLTQDKNIESWNAAAQRLFGWTAAEIVGRSVREIVPAGHADELSWLRDRIESGERVESFETVRLRKDGAEVEVSLSLSPIRDAGGTVVGVSAIARDVGRARQAERALQGALREKEALLKEVHHRVKNNLQVISSLVSLQRAHGEGARLVDLQGRIRAIALFHEMIYRSSDLASVSIGEYLRDVASEQLRQHGERASEVRVVVDAADARLPADTAIPCALIVNELVANALEHAFPDGRSGTIRVAFRADGHSSEILVADDGIGLAPGLDPGNTPTLGLQLVSTLADQLRGSVEHVCDNGLLVRVRFETGE